MSRLAKIGWALAAFVILFLGAVAVVNPGPPLYHYALGVIFGSWWAWILKGVR